MNTLSQWRMVVGETSRTSRYKIDKIEKHCCPTRYSLDMGYDIKCHYFSFTMVMKKYHHPREMVERDGAYLDAVPLSGTYNQANLHYYETPK